MNTSLEDLPTVQLLENENTHLDTLKPIGNPVYIESIHLFINKLRHLLRYTLPSYTPLRYPCFVIKTEKRRVFIGINFHGKKTRILLVRIAHFVGISAELISANFTQFPLISSSLFYS